MRVSKHLASCLISATVLAILVSCGKAPAPPAAIVHKSTGDFPNAS